MFKPRSLRVSVSLVWRDYVWKFMAGYSSWKTIKVVVCKARRACRLLEVAAQPILLLQRSATLPLWMGHFRPAGEPCTTPSKDSTAFSLLRFELTAAALEGLRTEAFGVCSWGLPFCTPCTGLERAIKGGKAGDSGDSRALMLASWFQYFWAFRTGVCCWTSLCSSFMSVKWESCYFLHRRPMEKNEQGKSTVGDTEPASLWELSASYSRWGEGEGWEHPQVRKRSLLWLVKIPCLLVEELF